MIPLAVWILLVILSQAGFWFLAGRSKPLFLAAYLVFLVYLLRVATRPVPPDPGGSIILQLAEIAAVFSLPLGALVQGLLEKGVKGKIILVVTGGLLLLLFVFPAWPWSTGSPAPVKSSGLVHQDSIPAELAGQDSLLAQFDFESVEAGTESGRTSSIAHTGQWSFCLENPPGFSPGLWLPLAAGDSIRNTWIRVTAFFYFTCISKENEVRMVITCNRRGKAFKYRFLDLSDLKYFPGRWNRAEMSYLVPAPVQPGDVLQVYFWNRGEKQCHIDDFRITLCREGGKP